jgi:hypothetical protein
VSRGDIFCSTMDEEDDFISFIPPRKRTKLNVDAEGRSQEALDQILLAFDPLQQKKERPPTVGSHASLADIGLLRRAQQSHNKKRAAQKSAPKYASYFTPVSPAIGTCDHHKQFLIEIYFPPQTKPSPTSLPPAVSLPLSK